MKKLKAISLVIFVASTLTACGQNDKVPANIKTAFSERFPSAKNVDWGKESKTEWEAEFKMDGIAYSANFNLQGQWLETEHEIKEADLPEKVKTSMDNQYAGYEIKEAEISETEDGRVYEILIKKDGKKMEISLSMDGEIQQKEMSTEENEE